MESRKMENTHCLKEKKVLLRENPQKYSGADYIKTFKDVYVKTKVD
jgi:hypothetical protein